MEVPPAPDGEVLPPLLRLQEAVVDAPHDLVLLKPPMLQENDQHAVRQVPAHDLPQQPRVLGEDAHHRLQHLVCIVVGINTAIIGVSGI